MLQYATEKGKNGSAAKRGTALGQSRHKRAQSMFVGRRGTGVSDACGGVVVPLLAVPARKKTTVPVASVCCLSASLCALLCKAAQSV